MRNRHNQVYDMSSYYIQIDSLFKTLCETQKSAGVEPTLEEAVFDPDTNLKYKRFQKRGEAEEAKYQSLKNDIKTRTVVRVDEEPDTEDEDDSGRFIKGTRVPSCEYLRKKIYNISDDENDIYICDFCSKIGYRQKYDPAICDNCTDCIECSDYSNNECSGCSYSRYREGRPYSDFLALEDMLSPDEIALLDSIRNRSYDKKKKERKTDFHVNDY